MKKIAFVSLVVLSLLLLTTAAQAAPTTRLRLQGGAVIASYGHFDPATCVNTSIFLSAYENEQQTSGGPETRTLMFLDIYVYNDCALTESLAIFAEVEPAPGALQVKGHAQSARLQTSLLLPDSISGNTVPVVIDLVWNGEGEPTQSASHQSYFTPTGRTSVHYNAVERNAQVTGSINVSGTNLIAQAQSAFSSISILNSGTMTHN
jgi:hypothetical protein